MQSSNGLVFGIGAIAVLALALAAAPFVIRGGADTPAPAPEAAGGDVREQVRAYLLENPEILIEMTDILEQRAQAARADESRAAIAAARETIYDDPFAQYLGAAASADVTIVEFFDYRCGFCRRARPNVTAFLESDPGVRVLLKEFPILGPASEFASRAAIAAAKQGRYIEMHEALYAHDGQLDEAAVRAIADGVGLDVAKLEADMGGQDVTDIIERNYALARSLGIDGTPTFLFGGEIRPGVVSQKELEAYVAGLRASPAN